MNIPTRFPVLLQVTEPVGKRCCCGMTDLYDATYVQGSTVREDRLEAVQPFKALPNVQEGTPAFDSQGRRAWSTCMEPAFFAGDDRLIDGEVELAAFSPDGQRLAYMEHVPPWNTRRLFVAAADGSQPRRWDFPGITLNGLAFSPDSKKLWLTTGGGLYNIELGSGKYERVPMDHCVDAFSFSPDGTRLAYFESSVLRCRDLETGIDRTLDDLNRYKCGGAPVFTPDGSRVLYTCSDHSSEQEPAELWVVPTRGGKPRRLESPPVVRLATCGGANSEAA